MKFKSNIESQAGIEDSSGSAGTSGQILSSLGPVAGVDGVDWIDPANIVTSATDVIIECKNTSGITIAKGTPVYQTGNVGATAVIEVAVADASDEDKMAAIGLLQSDLINNAFGYVVVTGELLNITTSPIDGVTPTTGDTIYVKSGGGLTLTKPTGVNFIQNVGLVGKVSGGNAGSLTVSSIMRSNDVPTPLYIDHDNQILGIGTTSPSVYHKLDVNGSANFSTDIVVGRNATALSFDMNPAYDSGNYYLKLYKNQSNDGGILLKSKVTGGNSQNDWQIVNQGTTGDLKFYAYGLGGNAFVLDRETGNLQLPEYGAGTLVSDASGNITVSSGGGAGGPYLPLAGGTMTGNLFIEGASTPKITITDTTNNLEGRIRVANNYMYIEADNSGAVVSTRIVLKTDGVEALYLNGNQDVIVPNGNVGIGTTSPDYLLDVSGSANNADIGIRINNTFDDNDPASEPNSVLFLNAASNNGYLRVHGAPANTAAKHQIDLGSTAASSFLTFSPSGAEAMRIDASGNVGIGTTSPTEALMVEGWIRVANNTGIKFNTSASSGDPTLNIDSSAHWNFLNTAGNNLLKIDNGGNVGIGTTSPSEKLEVAGNIKVDNVLLSNQQNTDVSGLELVANVLIASYTAAFFDFVIKKGTNVRSGTVYACHDGTNVEFTETSTNDLGNTSDVVLSVDISGTNMRLLADAATSGWSVKSLIRAI
jgi:hypothetical protein